MPAVSHARRKRFDYKQLPRWVQWALPFGIAGAAILALVLWVNHEQPYNGSEAPVIQPSAIREQNREDNILMAQTELPHTVALTAGVKPAVAMRLAISTWLDNQIKNGEMNGPLTRGHCATTAGSTTSRVALKCSMVTAQVTYPFYGVVTPATHKLTYCQQVVAPVYGMKGHPLSKSCLAS